MPVVGEGERKVAKPGSPALWSLAIVVTFGLVLLIVPFVSPVEFPLGTAHVTVSSYVIDPGKVPRVGCFGAFLPEQGLTRLYDNQQGVCVGSCTLRLHNWIYEVRWIVLHA